MKRLAASILVASMACGGSTTGPQSPPPPPPFDPNLATQVEVTPAVLGLTAIGATGTLTARVLNARGGVVAGAAVSWSSQNQPVATVSPAGVVTAVGNGQANIMATSGSLTGVAVVTVAQAANRLVVGRDSVHFVSVGDTVSVSLTVLDSLGTPVAGASPRWRTSAPAIVSVDTLTGRMTSVSNGTAMVTVHAGSAVAVVKVVVRQVAASLQLTASADTLRSLGDTLALSIAGQDARGNPIQAPAVTWQSSNPLAVRITPAGLAIAEGEGVATVTATVVVAAPEAAATSPATATLMLFVAQRPASITWDPLPASILATAPLTSLQFRVQDARGHVVGSLSPPVTVSLLAGPSGGSAMGNLTFQTHAGLGHLDGVQLSKAGRDYRLRLSSPGLPPADSPPFIARHRLHSLVVGGSWACARDQMGATWCWGLNDGHLYRRPEDQNVWPVRAQALDLFPTLVAGGATMCGFDGVDGLSCWGNIVHPPTSTITPIPGTGGMWPLDTENWGCGVRFGQMLCWGAFGPGGVLGAVAMAGPSETIESVGTGVFHYCAVTTTRAIHCGGNNEQGQLGNGTTDYSGVLVAASGAFEYSTVAGGASHTCALTVTWQLVCWGDNRKGELGDFGLGPRQLSPVVVPTPVPLTSLSLGFFHGCGLGNDFAVYCWGSGANGALGTGVELAGDPRVRKVDLPVEVLWVGTGGHHTCAMAGSGETFCWGNNSYGQLGDGTTAWSFLPRQVTVAP